MKHESCTLAVGVIELYMPEPQDADECRQEFCNYKDVYGMFHTWESEWIPPGYVIYATIVEEEEVSPYSFGASINGNGQR